MAKKKTILAIQNGKPAVLEGEELVRAKALLDGLKEFRKFRAARSNLERYKKLRRAAKKDNREFDISEAQYDSITESNCFYCRGALPEVGYGIDRKDASRGYTLDNVVACCEHCNTYKFDTLSFEEMIIAVANLKATRGEDIWADRFLPKHKRGKERFYPSDFGRMPHSVKIHNASWTINQIKENLDDREA